MEKSPEQAESLMNSAFELIEEEEYDEAMKIAEKLKEMRHSSNFEIRAIIYRNQGDNQKAITVLEEGVQRAPKVWRLWQLLGNIYSDETCYDKAQHCYQSALKQPNVNESSVYLNSSIAYQRAKQYTAALVAVERMNDKSLALKAAAQKIELLASLERFSEAIDLGVQIINSDLWSNDLYEPEDLASIYSALSMAYFNFKELNKAIDFAWKAIQTYKNNSQAAWHIREIENQYSKNSKGFRIMLEGTWHFPFEDETDCPGFFTNYDVVAENEEEALLFMKRFEPEEVRSSLKITEAEVICDAPDQPKGIYSTSGYSFFPQKET